MPLKLIEPRSGRSANYRVRGTYLGVSVDRSTGSPNREVAKRKLAQIKAEIERGEFAERPELTFAAAALAYINAGGETRFLKPVTDYFGPNTLAKNIDQASVDACAVATYPNATPATRNRQVYSPVSAILQHVGIKLNLRRPKGAEGVVRVEWLKPEQAAAAIDAAREIDPEFAAFLVLLLYTGLRLSEALGLEVARIDLQSGLAFIPNTKTGVPRTVHLPPPVVAELANMGLEGRTRVFRWHKGGGLYDLVRDTSKRVGFKVGFHMMRHTYATWMRLYANLSVEDLAQTGAWSSAKSAKRYAHIDALDTARRADALPTLKSKKRAKAVDHGK